MDLPLKPNEGPADMTSEVPLFAKSSSVSIVSPSAKSSSESSVAPFDGHSSNQIEDRQM